MNRMKRPLFRSSLALTGLTTLALGLACTVNVSTGSEAPDAGAQADAAPSAVVWPDEAFRATQPEPGPTPKLSVPTPQQFTLDNGLDVALVPHRSRCSPCPWSSP